jgi:hypothetical protein
MTLLLAPFKKGRITYSVTVQGSAEPLSGGLEGGNVVLKSGTDPSTISIPSSSGNYLLRDFKDQGSNSAIVVDQHPLNQLCVIRSGAADPTLSLQCVPKSLNDTGLSACRSAATCLSEDAGSGRDYIAARLRKAGNPLSPLGFDYTRICNNAAEEGSPGCALAANASPGEAPSDWGCTRDNHTGLVWRVVNFGGRSTYMEALNRAVDLQKQKWCGRDGWTLPSAHQLQSVLNSGGTERGAYRIAASLTFLPPFDFEARNKASGDEPSELLELGGYWTGDPAFGSAGNAWAVSFVGAGRVKQQSMDIALHLVPVSKADFQLRFIDPYHKLDRWQLDAAAGTLLDRRSGLMWMVCSAGGTYNAATQSCGVGVASTFGDALDQPARVNSGGPALNRGYSDWRLPNRAELGSLVDYQQSFPAVSSDRALTQSLRQDLGVRAGAYWTSSWVPSAGSGGDVFFVDFETGEISLTPSLDEPLRVRLVRDAR